MAAEPDLPTGEAKVRAVRSMFDTIAPRYDRVNRIMTFRLDVLWRRRTVRELYLAPGSTVLDLACGTGDFCNDLERAGHHPIGYDLSGGMLAAATTVAPLVHADVLRLPVPDSAIDAVTCGFALRNVVDLAAFFDEIGRVVRPGGRIGLLEVGQPENRLVRWGYDAYFGRIVPMVGGLLSDREAYQYLPRSVEYLPPPSRLAMMLRTSGFDEPRRIQLHGGIAQLITATRR